MLVATMQAVSPYQFLRDPITMIDRDLFVVLNIVLAFGCDWQTMLLTWTELVPLSVLFYRLCQARSRPSRERCVAPESYAAVWRIPNRQVIPRSEAPLSIRE
ncbi:hypothetical protein OE88DRAFT_546597 [Heliocybe sulcata]|uniref:Uncharacterized protein n=1 Tax=Heliocybe sulcata TaxID=5364 RepID=A0A5C3MRP5_9AGAM|nr:hypothetical protein OE88DRAFT_546597 [Heliocybe sulcata]